MPWWPRNSHTWRILVVSYNHMQKSVLPIAPVLNHPILAHVSPLLDLLAGQKVPKIRQKITVCDYYLNIGTANGFLDWLQLEGIVFWSMIYVLFLDEQIKNIIYMFIVINRFTIMKTGVGEHLKLRLLSKILFTIKHWESVVQRHLLITVTY